MSVEPVYLLSVQLLLSLISNASLRPFPFRAHEKMALFNTVFLFDSLFEAVACWPCPWVCQPTYGYGYLDARSLELKVS